MENSYQKRIVTVPNCISLFRLLLIPLFGWLYWGIKEHIYAAIVLTVSGISDIADGIIARRFHMESNVGRVLDPTADKMMQVTMCAALISRYPIMFWLLIFFAVKEAALLALGSFYMKRTGVVNSARWYGKASSIVQYPVMLVLILFPEISSYSAYVLIWLCIITHAMSLLLYVVFYVRSFSNPAHEPGVAMRPIDWQVMVMYILLMISVFVLMYTEGDSHLSMVLPKTLYLFLRFAAIVGTMGVPSFFLGEKLPRSWFKADAFPYRCYKWEKEGRFYEKIGVHKWKTLTPDMSKYIKRTFAKQGNIMRNPEHLRRFVAETCSAEFVHWMLILLSPAFVVLMGGYGVAAMVAYIIGNLVSIIIQRYNRPRLMKIIQRIEKRNASTANSDS